MKKCSGTTRIGVITAVVVGLALAVAIVVVVRLDTTGRSGSGLGVEFVYDINELSRVDPNLIRYQQEAAQAVKTGFSSSRAIAVDSGGAIYVAGDKAVRLFRQNGDLLGEIELTDEPRCLSVAGDGGIFVGMREHVEVYNSQRKRLAGWDSLGEKAVLTSIAVAGNDVFVADAGNRIVVHYDTAGKIVNRIGRKDPDRNIPGFVIPSPYFDLSVAKDGLLRVVNPGRHRIEAYTFDGDFEFWWGKHSPAIEGFCGCCNPVNFAFLPDGGFVTCEKGLVRVKVYDSDGGFVGVVAAPAQLARDGQSKICNAPQDCQAGGFDVAVDADGKVYVLDTTRNMVRIFSRKGSGG